MQTKLIKLGLEAKEAIKAGIDKAANAARVTLGPAGHTVVLGRDFGSPVITDDGVTVAKDIVLPDPFENVGASLIREIASKTNEVAGDGTTTSIVLAQAMVQAASEIMTLNSSKAALIKRGMDKAVDFVVSELNLMKSDINTHDEIKQVATISSLDEEVGELIASIMDEVGKDGVITVEEGSTTGLEKEVVKGIRFDRGYLSPYMVSNREKMEAVMSNAPILITDRKIENITELIPVMEQIIAQEQNQLVIICEDVSDVALQTLITNRIRGIFDVLIIRAPMYGERRHDILGDIAALVGGQYYSEALGQTLKEVSLDKLGKARKIIATASATTILEGQADEKAVTERIELVRGQLDESKSEFDKEKYRERLARLTGGIGIIRVGAPTETEMKARKFKIEDALNATRAAVEEGTVPGGGVALASIDMQAYVSGQPVFEKLGAALIQSVLKAPLEQIAVNTGNTAEAITAQVKQDVKIVDPVKVTRLALQNAASIAGTLITSEAIIVDKPKKDKDDENEGIR